MNAEKVIGSIFEFNILYKNLKIKREYLSHEIIQKIINLSVSFNVILTMCLSLLSVAVTEYTDCVVIFKKRKFVSQHPGGWEVPALSESFSVDEERKDEGNQPRPKPGKTAAPS